MDVLKLKVFFIFALVALSAPALSLDTDDAITDASFFISGSEKVSDVHPGKFRGMRRSRWRFSRKRHGSRRGRSSRRGDSSM